MNFDISSATDADRQDFWYGPAWPPPAAAAETHETLEAIRGATARSEAFAWADELPMPAPLWSLPAGFAPAPATPVLGFATTAALASELARDALAAAAAEVTVPAPSFDFAAFALAALAAAQFETARARAILEAACLRAAEKVGAVGEFANHLRAEIKARVGQIGTASLRRLDAYREMEARGGNRGLPARLFGFGAVGPRGTPVDVALAILHGDGIALGCVTPDDLIYALADEATATGARAKLTAAAAAEADNDAVLEAAEIDAMIYDQLAAAREFDTAF